MTDAEIIGLVAAGAIGAALQQLRHIDRILLESQAGQATVQRVQEELVQMNKLNIPAHHGEPGNVQVDQQRDL